MAALVHRLDGLLRTHARLVRVIALGVGVLFAMLAAANVAGALATQAELEVREGTVWLHVLAQQAGVSLYDHGRVAFVNMNHGPLDAWFKGVVHQLAPFLPAQAVTRCFVPLLPMALVVVFARAARDGTAGLLVGTAVYLVFLGIGPAQFLVGRSDPTALVLLCGFLLVADGAGSTIGAPPGTADTPWRARWLLLGALGAATLFTNWRFGAVVAGAGLLTLADIGGAQRLGGRTATAMAALAWMTIGAGLVAAAVWLGLFGGDVALYYRHVFGLFTKESGWGTLGRMPFWVVAGEITEGRGWFHLVLALAWAGAVAAEWRRGHRIEASAAVAGTAFALTATCIGFGRNHGAGGVHYFAPLYIWIVAYALARVRWRDVDPSLRLGLAVALIAGLPYAVVAGQAGELAQRARQTREPFAALQQLARDEGVYSEDVHLFRERYTGQVVDVGDTAAAVARTGYFSARFSETYTRHHRALAAQPPRFVAVCALSVVSPQLQELLRREYVLASETPLMVGLNPGLPVQVYERRAAAGDRNETLRFQ